MNEQCMKRHVRSGFTLIELLCVLAIILILMGLTLPNLPGVRRAAYVARVKSEIAVIAGAATKFAGDHYGAQPKVNGGGPNGEFRLCTDYSTVQSWPEVQWLKLCWSNMDLNDNGLRINGNKVLPSSPELLDGNQAYVFWTTGGTFLEFKGFSRNSRKPFSKPIVGENRIKCTAPPLNRLMDKAGNYDNRWRDPQGVPYVIMGVDQSKHGFQTTSSNGVAPYTRRISTSAVVAYNEGTFQIICAGSDGKFGPGGELTPGTGAWAKGQPGADDLSNFYDHPLGQKEQ